MGLKSLQNSVVLRIVNNLFQKSPECFLRNIDAIMVRYECFLDQLVFIGNRIFVGEGQGINQFTFLAFPLFERPAAANIIQIDNPAAPGFSRFH